MPNVLKVTTPGAGFDNTNIRSNPQPGKTDGQIQIPVDPNRVTRGDNRADSGQNQGGELEFHYESNFNAFVQLMRSAPQLLDELGDLLFSGLGGAENMQSLGNASPAFQEALMELMELAHLTPSQVAGALKEQVDSAGRFHGGLFALLRQAFGESRSSSAKADILNFLRHYNDMASGPHLLNRMKTLTDSIRGQMYQGGREKLDESLKNMNWGARAGDTWQNASALKEDVLPMLSRYISMTRDMGPIRDNISYLSVLISHYENGSLEEVVQSFDRMMTYPEVRRLLGNLSEEQLKEALGRMDFEAEAGKTPWTEKFQSLLAKGAAGEAGLEHRSAFLNVIHSMTLNESVYMPLLHLVFPINIDGRSMVTELWVDPDNEKGSGGEERRIPVQKLFVKFDIQGLGTFDLILLCKEHDISVQLRYPESLIQFEEEIQNQMGQIAQRNGYRMSQMVLETFKRPLQVLEVFPEIYERKRSVNVRV